MKPFKGGLIHDRPFLGIGRACCVEAADIFDPVRHTGAVVPGLHVDVEHVVDLVRDGLIVKSSGDRTRAAAPPATVARFHADHQAYALSVRTDPVSIEIVKIGRVDRAGEPVGGDIREDHYILPERSPELGQTGFHLLFFFSGKDVRDVDHTGGFFVVIKGKRERILRIPGGKSRVPVSDAEIVIGLLTVRQHSVTVRERSLSRTPFLRVCSACCRFSGVDGGGNGQERIRQKRSFRKGGEYAGKNQTAGQKKGDQDRYPFRACSVSVFILHTCILYTCILHTCLL